MTSGACADLGESARIGTGQRTVVKEHDLAVGVNGDGAGAVDDGGGIIGRIVGRVLQSAAAEGDGTCGAIAAVVVTGRVRRR